jgi:hypothetical protein
MARAPKLRPVVIEHATFVIERFAFVNATLKAITAQLTLIAEPIALVTDHLAFVPVQRIWLLRRTYGDLANRRAFFMAASCFCYGSPIRHAAFQANAIGAIPFFSEL